MASEMNDRAFHSARRIKQVNSPPKTLLREVSLSCRQEAKENHNGMGCTALITHFGASKALSSLIFVPFNASRPVIRQSLLC